ncbi:organic radical activating enzyme [Arcticibacter tournemirensis]|uniref:7-carboxy-7-deazaguanine synthase n=1 Tax=Arcticibacter tournemirensis TaxID=699437 RepID=A0A5M9GKI2_9SPHI|nr:7-carboxy-7-deazaguanine synthase QueE [Arcticibacter tournemirensis]KAA8474255.1 radical SAM protein [Arcticibacter tournemirensis]TQM51223.1 organic radical activating enzyme [Arcticibacter tournemirensis]
MTKVPEDGSLLPLMEEFYTIQGEGYHSGKAAYFIRLGGCDVGCHWCDVKESWDAELHPLTPADQIIENAAKYPGKAVVITGGEPLIYNLDYLTAGLHDRGIKTFIETSGAYPLSGEWDWICLSPKKFKAPLPEIAPKAGELKIIVFNKSDLAWAEKYAGMVSPSCKLYLQPEWSKAGEVTSLIIDYVKENPKWEISLQTHKYLNIP